MISVIATIIAALKAGMQTGVPTTTDYYTKSFYTYDPFGVPSIEVPACAVIPDAGANNSRVSVFVGEDTITENIVIRFYQEALRKAADTYYTGAGMTRLLAQYEKAQVILRTDPTFNGVFVSSEIINAKPLLAAVPEADAYRKAELTLKVLSRALWGA